MRGAGTISVPRPITFPLGAKRRPQSFLPSGTSSTLLSVNDKLLTTSWHKLPRKTLRALQAKRLRAYLRDVVLPFHPHYREVFAKHDLDWRAIGTLDDLQRIPFTSKGDLAGGPERTRRFVIIPDAHQLARRPSTIFRGLVRGRNRVRRELEKEFRPILMTSTDRPISGTDRLCLYRPRSRDPEDSGLPPHAVGGSSAGRPHVEHVSFCTTSCVLADALRGN